MLADRVDENLFEFYEFAALAAGRPCASVEGFTYISLSPSPWANTAYRLNFPANRDLPLALSEGIRSGAIPNQIRVGPTSCPTDIEARLAAAGLTLEGTTRGMILDVGRRMRYPAPLGFSLRLLRDEVDFSAFAGIVVAELFEKGPDSALPFALLLGSLKSDRAFGFLGSFQGEVVSTAFAFIDGEGGGGLYFVATGASNRGRGYAKATVGAVLDELEERGSRSCILQATELGKPVYESLGFIDSCRLARYRLGEADPPR
jgi:GNAT superfamily N-acetyltransferase